MDIIEKARELGKVIQQSEEYLALTKAKQNNDNNLELQKKINDFNLKKIALNHEVARENRDNEKIMKFDREMREAYHDVMNDPDMKAYSEAKNKIDSYIKKIEMLLALTLNGEDPETVTIPESTGCTGDCSSCGGCH